jgi:hypothetical protein
VQLVMVSFLKIKKLPLSVVVMLLLKKQCFLPNLHPKVKLIHRRDKLRAEKMLQKKLMKIKKSKSFGIVLLKR